MYCPKHLRWGLLSQFPPFCYFPNVFSITNVHVSYWMSHFHFTGIAAAQLQWHLSLFVVNENLAYGEINERSFNNTPTPKCCRTCNTSNIPMGLPFYFSELFSSLERSHIRRRRHKIMAVSFAQRWEHWDFDLTWPGCGLAFFPCDTVRDPKNLLCWHPNINQTPQ